VAGESTERRGWKRLLPKDPWQVVIGPILVVLVGAGVTLLVSSGGSDGGSNGGSHNKAAELQPLAPVVENPVRRYAGDVVKSGPNKGLTAFHQTDGSKPRVEIRLHNVGNQRAVLTSARFTVRRFAIVSPCGQGAALFVSRKYDVTLPEGAGRTVEVPIDQQLGPDQADRFVFRLTAQGYKRHIADALVYEIDVSVMHDNSPKPLRVGRVVIAIPGALEPDRLSGFNANGDQCPKRPPDEQRMAATFTGVRSPELDSYLRFLRTAGGGA